MKKQIALVVPAVAVLVSGGALTLSSQTAAAPPAAPAAFNQCTACHAVEAGEHGIGPSLAGVVGRKAGTQKGYAYSDALAKSGKVWTEAELNTFLANPSKAVPGTRMVIPVRNGAQRRAIIDYLKTL